MIISLGQRALIYKQNRLENVNRRKRGAPVYNVYTFSIRERCMYMAFGILVTLFFGYFFYRSAWSCIFLWPVGLYTYQSIRKNKKRIRIDRLEIEFKDCILSVSANLRAGYSIENAFIESQKDMYLLYGRDSLIGKELRHMQKGINNNLPIEDILQEFSDRSTSVRIKEFSEVLRIARKNGGKLPEIIQATSQVISQEITIKQEIEIMISGRVFEQKIMNVVPFALVTYIEITNSGFFDVMYDGLTGYAVMTMCLVIYISAYALSVKICN